MFIKDNLVFKPRRDLNIILPFMECSFIEIHLNNQQYLIGGIYRIPKTNIYSFIDQLNRLLEPLRSTYKLILLGDYNIDLKKTTIIRMTLKCAFSQIILCQLFLVQLE